MFNEKMVGDRFTIAKQWIVVGIIVLCTTFAFTVRADILEDADDLDVSLTVSPSTARPGNDVMYTLTVDYIGSETEEVKVTGQLLDMSAVGTYTRLPGDSNVQTTESLLITLEDGLSWAGMMPSNTSISFQYTATLSTALEDQDVAENVASALIVGSEGASDTATVLIDTAGPLRPSEFTAANSVVTLGDSVELTLHIENGGDGLIDDGMVEISVPAEWTIDTDSVPSSVSGTGSAIDVTEITEDGIIGDLFVSNGQSIDLTFSVMLDADAVPNELSIITARLSDGEGNVSVENVELEKAGPLKDSALTVSNEVIGAGRDREIMFTLNNESPTDVNGTIEIVVDSDLTLVEDSVPSANINATSSTIRDIEVNGNTITANFAFLGAAEISFRFDVMADEDAVEGTDYTITAEITQEGFNPISRDLMLVAGTPEQITYLPLVSLRLPVPPILSFEIMDDGEYKLLWSGVPRVKNNTTVRYLLQESTSANFATVTEQFYTSSQLEAEFTDKDSGVYYYRVINYETVEGQQFISEPSNVVAIDITSSVSGDFKVDDNTLEAGECTKLRWEFENVSSIKVSFGEGFDPIGVQGGDHDNADICPGVDTTYRAIVEDEDGNETEYTLDVDVRNSDGCNDGDTDPYVVETLTADDTTVQTNQRATLSWHIECAAEVYFKEGESNEIGVEGDGSRQTSGITGDTLYYVRANGSVDYDGTYGDSFNRFLMFIQIEEE